MKNILTIAIVTAALFAPMGAQAAKPKKDGKGSAKAVRQYDTNASGAIDGSEIEALRKAFAADKTGPLKDLDTNADGSLSDSEIAAVKVKAKKKNK